MRYVSRKDAGDNRAGSRFNTLSHLVGLRQSHNEESQMKEKPRPRGKKKQAAALIPAARLRVPTLGMLLAVFTSTRRSNHTPDTGSRTRRRDTRTRKDTADSNRSGTAD